MTEGRSALRRLVGWLISAAALGFIGWEIARHASDAQRALALSRPLWLVASVGLQAAIFVGGAFQWQQVTTRFPSPPPSARTLLWIWSRSNLARYIPGAVWQLVAARQAAPELPAPLVFGSLAVHVGITLAGAAVCGAISGVMAQGPFASALVVVIALLAVHPRIITACLSLLGRVLPKGPMIWGGRWRDGLFLLGLSVLSWMAAGGAYALFLRSLNDSAWLSLREAAGVNALSFLAGYLVLLAPGGLGVREAAMALLLSRGMPAGEAAAFAALARLWSIAAELLTFAGTLLVRPRSS